MGCASSKDNAVGVEPNPILVKVKWTFKDGRREDFEKNQKLLCKAVQEHKGIVTYHVDYPEDENYSEWTELYSNDASFKAHLDNEKGKDPLGVCVDASEKIECRVWGNPSDATKEILAGFGAVYMETAVNSFALHPELDTSATV